MVPSPLRSVLNAMTPDTIEALGTRAVKQQQSKVQCLNKDCRWFFLVQDGLDEKLERLRFTCVCPI